MRIARDRKVVLLGAAAALSVLAVGAWTVRRVLVAEWHLFRWRHAEPSGKEEHLRTLVDVGSVRALNCLETDGILYVVDVGVCGKPRPRGGRVLAEVRSHLRALSPTQRFAIAWVGNGVSVFPPLEPGPQRPQLAEAK
ncbi:MAG: hypothetical protein ACRD2T_00860, partial [Thermoanaerobaculia bacterium]